MLTPISPWCNWVTPALPALLYRLRVPQKPFEAKTKPFAPVTSYFSTQVLTPAQVSPLSQKPRIGLWLHHSPTVLSSIPRCHQLHSYPDSGGDHPGQRGQPEVQVQPLKGLGRYLPGASCPSWIEKPPVSPGIWQFLNDAFEVRVWWGGFEATDSAVRDVA